MSFAAPLGFLLLLGIPVVIAIHLLTRRAVRTEVPSLAIWRMVEPSRRSAWHLRLFRNLNLLLQLAAVIVLAVAASGPQLPRPALFGVDRAAIVLDSSASMNAAHAGGGTRFDRAQELAEELVKRLPDAAAVYVLQASSSVVPSDGRAAASPLTRRRIRSAAAHDTVGHPRAALERAQELLGNGPGAAIYFITDGAFSIDPAYLSSFRNLTVRTVVEQNGGSSAAASSTAENIGITQFAYREASGGSHELYLEAANFGSQRVESALTLRAPDKLLAERALSLEPGSRRGVSLTLSGALPDRLVAELNRDDALASDNRAALTPGSVRPVTVLVAGRKSVFLESFFRVHPRVQLTTAASLESLRQAPADAAYDIVVANELSSLPAAAGAYLAINSAVDGVPVEVGAESGRVDAVSWEGQHPLLSDVQLSELTVFRAARTRTSGAVSPVVRGSSGALIYAYRDDAVRVVSLQFSLLESNFSLLASFPVFLDNALTWLLPGSAVSRTAGYRTGEPLPLRRGSAEAVQVVLPNGRSVEVGGEERFLETQEAGIYRIRYQGGAEQEVAFNLLSAEESDLRPRLAVPGSEAGAAPGAGRAEPDQTLPVAVSLVVLIALLVADFAVWRRKRA